MEKNADRAIYHKGWRAVAASSSTMPAAPQPRGVRRFAAAFRADGGQPAPVRFKRHRVTI